MPKRYTIFSIAYFVFFLGMPLVYTERLVDPVLIPRQMWLTLMVTFLSVVLIWKIVRKELPINVGFMRHGVALSLLAGLALIFISLPQGSVLAEGLFVLSRNFILLVFFAITCFLLIHKQLSRKHLSLAVLAMLLMNFGIIAYQLFISNEPRMGLSGTMANKNLLASILVISIPFLISAGKWSKKWFAASGILVLLVLGVAWYLQARASILALAVFFLVLFVALLTVFRKRGSIRRVVRPALAAMLVLFVAGTAFTLRNPELFPRIFKTDTISERFSLWENSLSMMADHPLLGVGAGNWKMNVAKYGLENFVHGVQQGLTIFQRPHNDFLWAFCEQGVLGGLAYLGVFLLALYSLVVLIRKSREWTEQLTYVVWGAGLIAYMSIAALDFPLERFSHQAVLYALLALIVAAKYKDVETTKKRSSIVMLPAFVLVSIALSSAVTWHRAIGEHHTAQMYRDHAKHDWESTIASADRAQSFFYRIEPNAVPLDWYAGVSEFALNNRSVAFERFEKAHTFAPHNIHVLNNLGSCYEGQGNHEKAKEMYLEALEISPNFRQARLNLSATYFNTEEFEFAFRTIDQCSHKINQGSYLKYLPPILTKYVGTLITSEMPTAKVQELEALIAKPKKIVQLYREAKEKDVPFDAYVLDEND